MDKKISIGAKDIGVAEPTFFIADIAANHDGDLSRAKELIYLAAEAGADAAKFQHFEASTIVSDFGFRSLGDKQSHQAAWGKSVFEVYQDASVTLDWTEALKEACSAAGIPFFTTPYSLERVDQLEPHVPAYKIGSGDITWREMIERIASKGKPYILATGASTFDEVVEAVSWGTAINDQFCLMQCNTNYTANLENFRYIQLNVLKTYRTMYPNLVLGLSDHTPGHATVLGAISLGATVIEKHFTDNTARNGPDHKFSMDPNTWREMVDRARELEVSLGTGVKRVEPNEKETVVLQRRAYRAKKALTAGTYVSSVDFDVLRPCPSDAINPSFSLTGLNKRISRNIPPGDYLKWSDLVD